jgi:hypothetical protein
VPFFVTEPAVLSETDIYAKERRLIEDIREEMMRRYMPNHQNKARS